MSGSSRHGSVRPSAAGSRQGGGRPGGARQGGSRPGPARQGDGRSGGGQPGGARDTAADAERVAGLLEPVISAVGMDLEAVRVVAAGRRRLLRIVVDGDGGVSLDDIAVVSREVSAALDDSPVMGEQPYTLEVSSPGVDRPLTERRHWRRAIGRLVVAPLTGAAGTVEGRVTGASGEAITLEIDGQAREFGYGDLGPGRIKIEFAPISTNDGDLDDDSVDDDTDEDDNDEDDSNAEHSDTDSSDEYLEIDDEDIDADEAGLSEASPDDADLDGDGADEEGSRGH